MMLGDALDMLADFRMKHRQPAEAEQVLRRVLAIRGGGGAGPVRPSGHGADRSGRRLRLSRQEGRSRVASIGGPASAADGNPDVADALAGERWWRA